VDDDDATSDDDDATSDDDDAVDDDDAADDDDSVAPSELSLTATSTDFGNVGLNTTVSRTISLTNTGTAPLAWSMDFTFNGGNIFAIGGGGPSGMLPGGATIGRTISLTATQAGAIFTALRVTHDGANYDPQLLYFTAVAGGEPTEVSCNNGIDDDGDSYTDCEDWDCIGSPSCGDPCCGGMPWPGGESMCNNSNTLTCVCAADSWCCESGWSDGCWELYSGVTGSCPVPSCN